MIEEPWIEATIILPDEHLGGVLKLCRGSGAVFSRN